jgi:hypothetical protein
VYRDRPRGKENAVREGLRHVTGHVVLIQDADLEYDIRDYDDLVALVVQGQRAFVIGSRHSGGGSVWKIRQFDDMWLTALFNAVASRFPRDAESPVPAVAPGSVQHVQTDRDPSQLSGSIVLGRQEVRILRDLITWRRALIKYRFTRIG